MKTISLLLRILAIAGAVVAIIGWVATNNKVEDVTRSTKKALQRVDAARQEATDAEQRFKAADAKLKSLESDLAAAKSRATSARSQLAEAQREASSLRSEIKERQATISTLESQNSRLKEEMISMRTDVPEADSQQIAQYEERIASLNTEVQRLKEELANTTASVTAASPAVATATDALAASNRKGPAPRLATSEATTANVLRADNQNGLVIIDRGWRQGLEEEMEFGIAKGFSKPVQVKVTKTEPDYSLAYILPGSEGAKFAEGDEIKLLQ